jgi:uncharacterized protein YkwD
VFTQSSVRHAPALERAKRPTKFLLLPLVALAILLSACTPEQLDAFQRLNAERQANGLAAVNPQEALMTKAQVWADYLASIGSLQHSNVAEGAAPGWWILGENVGSGPSVEAVQAAFMNSPGHRANILNPEFNWAGAGVAVSGNGTVFVVQVFGKY